MTDQLKMAWMWATEDGDTNGLTIDGDPVRFNWYDSIGCACGDSTFVQTLDQYQAKGSPLGKLPDDVQAELDATAAVLDKNEL
jgi:hypothetical protein